MRGLRVVLPPVLAGLALVASGCGSSSAGTSAARSNAVARACPAAWVAGWQRLADRVDAPVYCPTWLPEPLDARLGGEYAPEPYVNPDRAYLVSMIWFEKIPNAPYEVHVNLRGYPGETAIPICEDTRIAGGKTVRPRIPCFADSHGRRRVGGTEVTVFTANQGADTWHVLYAWRRRGSLYTLSQHVAPPFTYRKVVGNLDRMLRGLVLLRPRGTG